ncbi:MAG: TPM domain-containing protein [Burkholderiales bacterium]
MKLRRLFRHLGFAPWRVRRAFPPAAMALIAAAFGAGEQGHSGEIRVAVEGALEPLALLRGQTAHERALEVFAQLRVWDTAYNNGVLIYVLMADHAVEIVADRGIHGRADGATWQGICRQVEAAFAQGGYPQGMALGVEAVAKVLLRHFAGAGANPDELPNIPVLL